MSKRIWLGGVVLLVAASCTVGWPQPSLARLLLMCRQLLDSWGQQVNCPRPASLQRMIKAFAVARVFCIW